jgi:rhomboid family GlyGly-CTERM serine protease
MEQTPQNSKSNTSWRSWWLPLLLLSLLLAVLGDGATEGLRYQRESILYGEWWRLFTGHLLHLGWYHLWLNLAGLLLVWMLVGHAFSTGSWAGVIGATLLGVSLGLLWWLPQLTWYVGLSGLLHGMLIAGSLQLALRGEREALLILLIVLGKVGWELWQGPLPGSREAAGGEVVVEAHALGLLCGAVYVVALRLSRRQPAST